MVIGILSVIFRCWKKQQGKINRSMESLNPQHAISNIKEFEFAKIFKTK